MRLLGTSYLAVGGVPETLSGQGLPTPESFSSAARFSFDAIHSIRYLICLISLKFIEIPIGGDSLEVLFFR